MPPINKKTQGSALLTALFIMTLVAIVATAMSTKLQVDIYRTRLIITHDRLYLASQAVAFWGLSELKDNKKKFTKANAQGMISQYPLALRTIYPSVTLSGGLYDLQSRYNLNNLSDHKATLGFINFVGYIAPQATTVERLGLARAISDWLSPFDLAVGKDAYLSYYLKQKPPYHSSHQIMSSSSELRLIKDVSAPLYLSLEPYITALPELTAININTAPKQTLMALSNAMNEEKTNEIIEARGEKGIKNIEKISPILQKLNIANNQITLESIYFLSIAHATTEDLNFTVYTLFKRSRDKKGKLSVTILRESFNVF
jgi:general secretion pathway protein K